VAERREGWEGNRIKKEFLTEELVKEETNSKWDQMLRGDVKHGGSGIVENH